MTIARMLQRRGTSAQWESVKTTLILGEGEIGLETDTGKFKIGDGATAWEDLPYYVRTEELDLYAKLTASQIFTGTQALSAPDAGTIPLEVRGVTSQSAKLQRWVIGTTELASVDPIGKITAAGGFDASSQKLINLAAPTSANDATSKTYVDTLKESLFVKDAVRVATTANITLSGTQTIDGISVVAGNRVLVKDQTTGSQNGIYVVASGSWSRATDANTSAKVKSGFIVFVSEGSSNADSGWVLKTNDTITLNTTALVFEKFSGLGQVTAGNGLAISNNTISVVGTNNRITSQAGSIDISSSYAGQSTITTVGALSSGSITDGFTTIGPQYGGTGIGGTTPYATGDILYASNSTTLSRLPAGASGRVLVTRNTSAAPEWKELDLSDLPTAAFKKSVRAATTGNITLSGTQTIDTIAVAVGDRVLVKDQTTASTNGIYVVASSTWTRAADANSSDDMGGAVVNINSGTQGGQLWTTSFKTTDTLGTTEMNWYRIHDTSRNVPVENGGTGASSPEQARINLGAASSSHQHSTADITDLANLAAVRVENTVTGSNSAELIRGNMADSDQFRILVGGTGANAGFAEIATADDGTEPIYVRQYSGVFTTALRTATLLDGSGDTSFPGQVTAANYRVSVSTEASDTVALNFASDTGLATRTATGNITFTGSSYTAGASITCRIVAGAAARTLTFPAGWVFVGSKPTQVAANKSGILTVTSFGTTEADCVASWVAQL